VQTVLGYLLPRPPVIAYTRRRLVGEDGDGFDVDVAVPPGVSLPPPEPAAAAAAVPDAVGGGAGGGGAPRRSRDATVAAAAAALGPLAGGAHPVAVVCHGLESSSTAVHTVRIVAPLLAAGWIVLALNSRGCSGTPASSPRMYHASFSDDLRLTVDAVGAGVAAGPARDASRAVIGLAGFSLGANIVAHYVGTLGAAAPAAGIRAAAVGCVPFDPAACQPRIDGGICRLLYANRFVGTIRAKAEGVVASLGGDAAAARVFDVERVRAARTIGEIDDAFIAPVFGFDGKEGYYAASNTVPLLKDVAVPMLCLNNLDDPFFEPTALPTEADVAGAPVVLVRGGADRGGRRVHVGMGRNASERRVRSPLGCTREQVATLLTELCLVFGGLTVVRWFPRWSHPLKRIPPSFLGDYRRTTNTAAIAASLKVRRRRGASTLWALSYRGSSPTRATRGWTCVHRPVDGPDPSGSVMFELGGFVGSCLSPGQTGRTCWYLTHSARSRHDTLRCLGRLRTERTRRRESAQRHVLLGYHFCACANQHHCTDTGPSHQLTAHVRRCKGLGTRPQPAIRWLAIQQGPCARAKKG